MEIWKIISSAKKSSIASAIITPVSNKNSIPVESGCLFFLCFFVFVCVAIVCYYFHS